jgi:pimeloyl-ACP methyl ester carboxylesterase
MKYRFLMYLLVSTVLPCFAQPKEYIDLATHETCFVEVQPDIKLEVLEWRGQGKSIVFLSGLGNSGHVFDEFANHFTPLHHVIAISRRGFGHSSQPESGYDATTRARDIKVILDSLSVEKAILIGHSIGGDELSTFRDYFQTVLKN